MPTARADSVTATAEATAASVLECLRVDYAAQRPKSEALFARAMKVLPGGNTRTPLYHDPFPCYLARGHGARVVDVDGFEYLDLVNNYTSLVHGHPSPELLSSLARQAAAGTALGGPTELEITLAQEIVSRVGSVEHVRFANSGTEATLYAVRTARAFTGRDAVIKVEGGYHGGTETLQVSVKTLGSVNEGVPEPGIPKVVATDTHIIPFNDTETAREIIRRVGTRAGALIVEPLQGGAGALPAQPEYLQMLRQVTAEVGCLLVFDEVMTLRLAHGGMQQVYEIYPDLTAMGKIIGGGLPVGAFGGRAEVMDVWAPQLSPPRYQAGTFNANPLTMVAGLHALRALTDQRIAEINRRGDAIRGMFNELSSGYGLPLIASGWGSVLQVHGGEEAPVSFRGAASRPRELVRCFHLLMLKNGMFVAPRGAMNISTAVADSDHEALIDAIDRSLDELRTALSA